MDIQIKNKKRENFGELVIIFAALISVFKNITDSSELFGFLDKFNNIILLIFLVCIGYKLLIQEYTFIKLVIIFGIGVICIYSTVVLKYYTFFYTYIFICALQNVDIKKVIKASMYMKLTLLSVHVFLFIAFFYLNPGLIIIFERNGIERYSFFMGHPNTFTAYLAWMLLEMIYIYYEKIKIWTMGIIWLVSIIFYCFTNSNTGTIVLSAVILIIYIEKFNNEKIKKAVRFMAGYGFMIFSLLFAFLSVIYVNLSGSLQSIWENFDSALTGRLMFGAYTYDNYGMTLIGRNITFPSKSFWHEHWIDAVYFDNSYYQFLFQMGGIYIILISIGMIYISKKTSSKENIFIIAGILYGIMEGYIINIFICFPFMFIGVYIFSKVDKSEKIKNKINMEGALWKK